MKKTKTKELKVGVIGLGMGRGHVQAFQSHPGSTVVAIADPDEARLAEIGAQYNVAQRYTSADEMLAKESLDIVSVATPNKFHAPLTLAAFKAGCHVLCEKPMAMNAAEARKMLAAAEKAQRRLMINFSFRFNGPSQALRKAVDSGMLGEIYFARTVWQRRRGMPRFGGWFGQKALAGGGPLIDLGVHRLDLALWLMGYPKPKWVLGGTYDHIVSPIARREKKAYDVEDFAAAMIRFENDAIIELEASWAGNIKENEYMQTRLLGTRGGLIQQNLNGGYEFEAEIFMEQDGVQYDMRPHAAPTEVKPSMHHFVDAILNNTPHPATGEEGLIVMELLDAIYKSAEKGDPIKVG